MSESSTNRLQLVLSALDEVRMALQQDSFLRNSGPDVPPIKLGIRDLAEAAVFAAELLAELGHRVEARRLQADAKILRDRVHEHMLSVWSVALSAEEVEAAHQYYGWFPIPPAEAEECETFLEIQKLGFLKRAEVLRRYVQQLIETFEQRAKASGGAGGKASKCRGRPPRTLVVKRKEAKLAADWQQARQTGVRKVDFAKQKKMQLKAFQRLLNRVYADKKSSE